ncbi:uncharacterized protein LOC123872307 [Maniola jurtina]|uniref:uncharacterized protein LOC123872307 n=1 Tax=Maniola jurtina TaxID=191418 RepID=UPI001E68A169|nr:uncharacterized protein LOC123872307 [Maniola jurtina]XP_045772474.1 uncharacterized protein LOC123872307 [Maniola jurtina]
MCYICSCFTWTLDLLQRILTFFLSCWLACSVCCGLGIAIIAGVAYGYNYCLAESIIHMRPDVRVYMRRGQFYDKPDMLFHHRIGDDDDDYQQEFSPGDGSLAKHWEKDQFTKKYAEKLTIYSNRKKEQNDKYRQQEDDSDSLQWKKGQDTPRRSSEKTFISADYQVPESNFYYKPRTPPVRRVSILPNPIIPTTVIQSGSSEIVMRIFEPVSNIVPEPSNEVDEYDDKSSWVIDKGIDSRIKPPEEIESRTKAFSPSIRMRLEDSPTRKLVKMRH